MAGSQSSGCASRAHGAPAARGADALVSHALAQRLDRAALAQGSTAAWAPRSNEQIIMTEELARVGAPQLPAQGLNHIGPILMEFGTDAQKAQTSAAHHCGYGDLGAGLFRAGRRLRPRQPFDPRNARGRSFRGARAKDLDHLGASFGLDVRAGAHRSAGAAAAGRHQLPADRSAQPGHQDQADQDDRGRRRVQRGVLRRRRSCRPKTWSASCTMAGASPMRCWDTSAWHLEPAIRIDGARAHQDDGARFRDHGGSGVPGSSRGGQHRCHGAVGAVQPCGGARPIRSKAPGRNRRSSRFSAPSFFSRSTTY